MNGLVNSTADTVFFPLACFCELMIILGVTTLILYFKSVRAVCYWNQ